MFDVQLVWLANSHGHILGETKLVYGQLLNGEKQFSAVTITRIYVRTFLEGINCDDNVTPEEIQVMIDNVYEDADKVIIKLPERFACPNHGFAEPS